MTEINKSMVVFMQIPLPIGFALFVRKQNHRFQSNAIRVMPVLGLGSTPLLIWLLNSMLAKSTS